jgi:hypothetical protein
MPRAAFAPGSCRAFLPTRATKRSRSARRRTLPLIAVRVPGGPLVLLEGHVRLTAYALFPDYLPPELEIYLGESSDLAGWSEY